MPSRMPRREISGVLWTVRMPMWRYVASPGLPAMSIPGGFDRQGLPIGLQIMGNYFAEAKLLNLAHQYQRETDWHTRGPQGL